MRLEGKVAIITGGGRGIGRSFAIAFGKEGAKVVVADIDLSAANETINELTKNGVEALSNRTDVSSIENTEEMVRQTIHHFGRIDILVNNAAILASFSPSRATPFYEIEVNEWDRVMAVNLKGIFLCTRAVFPYMKEQARGKIINMASSTFFWGPPNQAHYIASKGGVIGLSRALATELGRYQINVNCIAPGSTFSEDSTDQVAQEFRKLVIPRRAIRRLEYPEDLVGTAIFLASSDSDFITGQTIVVDGGQVMH